MTRLIDADRFIKENAEIIDCEINHPKYQATLRELIDEAPTVDRPNGEWLECKTMTGVKVYVCSACKSIFDDYIDKSKPCPNCGSDNRPKIHGCSFADEECKDNPCEDCGLKEGE